MKFEVVNAAQCGSGSVSSPIDKSLTDQDESASLCLTFYLVDPDGNAEESSSYRIEFSEFGDKEVALLADLLGELDALAEVANASDLRPIQ